MTPPKSPKSRTHSNASKRKKSATKPKRRKAPNAKKRNRGPSVTSPVRTVSTQPIGRRAVRLLAPILVGAILGLVIAGFFLWSRAIRDVDVFLSREPTHQPALLLSAPITLHAGQRLSEDELIRDLLSAGYERVSDLTGSNQFVVASGHFDIMTGPYTLPDGQVPASRDRITIVNGHIQQTSPTPAVLRPTVLARIGSLDQQRTPVSLKHISPYLPITVTGMEDHRFRDHGGIDPIGLLRALFHNLRSNKSIHGGSTITQQLAKNLFLSQDRTLQRKVREVFFAAALEARMSKDEILELYLSEVYLGQSSSVPLYGVDSASRAWFGVAADKLTLSQSALIAGVISAPNAYSPSRHPEMAEQRRNIVLKKLVRLGRISEKQATSAAQEPIVLADGWRGRSARAPWAMDAVSEQIEAALGPEALSRSGIRVHTTIQPHLQRIAQKAVTDGLSAIEKTHSSAKGAEGALVSINVQTGDIVALVGGRSYFDSPFNRATHAWRQAGSIVKPLLLLSAMNRDPTLHPASRIKDEPLERHLDGRLWRPSNSDGLFKGEVTLRDAIESSRNIPAIHLSERVGLSKFQKDLRTAGFSKASRLPSVALGAFPTTPLEAASAYSAFSNYGQLVEPRLVDAVVVGTDDVLWRAPKKTKQISNLASVNLTSSVLQGVLERGTARSSAQYGVGPEAGGKTGTTDQFRDAWFVGYTSTHSTAVWVGKDREKGMGLSGARAALPIWSNYVVQAGAQMGQLPQSSQSVTHTICSDSSQTATPQCPNIYDEIFWSTQVPPTTCEMHGTPKWSIGQLFKGLFKSKTPSSDSLAN